jgi:Cu/Ag efflux pump CusA
MEESDVIVKLKPKSEWVSAKTKDELADKIRAVKKFRIWKLNLRSLSKCDLMN